MPASSSRTAPIPPLGATASASTSRELDFWGKFRRGRVCGCRYFASIAVTTTQVLVGGAGRQLLRHRSDHRTAPAHCARERRAAETQPRDHRTPVQERQRVRARCPAGPDAVPEYRRCNSRARGQPASGAERAQRSARPPAGPLPEMERDARRFRPPSSSSSSTRPSCSRRRPDVRARRMRLAAQSAQIGVSEAALYPRSRWSARSASPPPRSTGRREPFNGASARPGMEHLRLGQAEGPGAGPGCTLPAALRAVSGHRAASRPRTRRFRHRFRAGSGPGRHPARAVQAPVGHSTSRTSSIARGWSALSASLTRNAACSASRSGWEYRGRRHPEPDCRLQGDGRRLAGRPRRASSMNRPAPQ